MELQVAIAVLLVLGPPAVLATFRPRTPRWAFARRLHWVALPALVGDFFVNLELVDPAGPAVFYYGAWFVLVVIAALWAFSVGYLRTEWSAWRERSAGRSEAADAGPFPRAGGPGRVADGGPR